MKLLHLIATLNPKSGGVCQALRTCIEGLEKIAVSNSVVCLDDATEEFLKDDKFKIFPIGTGKGPWCYNKDLITWLSKNLNNYDAIILHGLWLFPGYALNKVIEKNRKQNLSSIPSLFVMPHGMLDPYFQKAEGRKLKAIRNLVYWQLIEKKIINKADALLFTCEEEKYLASTYFKPYSPKKECIVSLGVPLPLQIPVNYDSNKLYNSRYLLFLSRIHPKKGVDLLVAAYSELASEDKYIPNLVIAGPGLDTTYGKEVYASVQENTAIRDKIIFQGMLTGHAKWDAFYNCEAFILPSHQENFGIAVVEALSCGKPVLITDKINIWREINSDKAGLVEPDTKEGIKNLLVRWLAFTENEKMSMSLSAGKCFSKNFTVDRAAAKMYNSLSEVIKSQS